MYSKAKEITAYTLIFIISVILGVDLMLGVMTEDFPRSILSVIAIIVVVILDILIISQVGKEDDPWDLKKKPHNKKIKR